MSSSGANKNRRTPVRGVLKPGSTLMPLVENGLGALKTKDRRCVAENVRRAFSDSLDLDKALRSEYPQQNRWDYLLGHDASRSVIGLEPHSAKTDQISTVIAKKKAAQAQLSTHLRSGKRIVRWIWVASGRNHIADTEKLARRLDENGITFVSREILVRHLPGSPDDGGPS
jgi:hypothetical protein